MSYEVDQETWEQLSESFDTRRLLRGLEVFEQLAARVCNGSLQRELRKIHQEADEVINEGNSHVFDDEITLWQDAQELGFEIEDWVEVLQDLTEALDQLGLLGPDFTLEETGGSI